MFVKKIKYKLLPIALCLSLTPQVNAFSLEGTPYEIAGIEYNLDPVLIFAVSLIESAKGRKEGVSPYPYALRTRHTPYYPASKEEAEPLLLELIDNHPNTDIGLMQISWRWHKDKVASPLDLLDPVTNVRVGAKILRRSIDSKPGNLKLGIGTYHSPTKERAENYGERVLAVYRNLQKMKGN